MSDELNKLTEAMTAVRGHLQDLQHEQSATTKELGKTGTEVQGLQGAFKDVHGAVKDLQDAVKDLQVGVQDLQVGVKGLQVGAKALQTSVKNLETRSVHMEASMAALGGTFASIEPILTTLLADHELLVALEKQNQELRREHVDLLRRVEALERKAS